MPFKELQSTNMSENEFLKKLVKILNFAKDRGHENFQFLTKF